VHAYFVVLARDAAGLRAKIEELTSLGYPFTIVCGEKVDLLGVVYRKPRGKFDAMNFGLTLVPPDADFVVFNDVDTKIHNFDEALDTIRREDPTLVFARVDVERGPQLTFYSFLDAVRKRVPIAASGELMLIKHDFLKKITPLRRCKAEDSYILFKALEKGEKVAFSEKCFVTTKRTEVAEQEEAYKRRTVGGIYQALSMSKPPVMIRIFYVLLPLVTPLLLIMGGKGYYWAKGILSGFVDYARGDTSGSWKPIGG